MEGYFSNFIEIRDILIRLCPLANVTSPSASLVSLEEKVEKRKIRLKIRRKEKGTGGSRARSALFFNKNPSPKAREMERSEV